MLDTFFASATLLLFTAILTESVTEIVKNLFPEGIIQDKATYVVSLIVGIVLVFTFDLNLFGLAGLGAVVAKVLAGIVASRGANYVNGFMKKFEILR
ncbi:hypothetical protein MOD67_14170 [Bacillus licheniformis]|uniref:hypothetical protein n=1 Tax=Bacillus TaxID=1386 RepID=UPI0020C928BC|nr:MULTISPECIES: hypothetical protein [Bacillus]MCP8973195.1 hypothetical protein [Bacillus licheniformis]MCY7861168.1 hypothetical protein [Bacillus haynesii]MCY8015503.1 hypothetical protein [Bacillus haynesii]MCY8291502.1 hypothetical protein [Bacillus haynesii]MCY8549126.1 hypothetical protein [Bacillus haynesii]